MHTYMHTCIHTGISNVQAYSGDVDKHTYIHTHMHTYMHTCIHTGTSHVQEYSGDADILWHTYIHTCIHRYIHICIHTCILVYIQARAMYKRIVEMLTNIVDVDKDGILTYEELRASGVCVCVFMFGYIYIYIYIYIYTHTQT